MAWQHQWRKHPTVRTGDQLSLGEKAADKMRNGMGSWPFVFVFFAVMIIWAVVNGVLHVGGGSGFDPYPFILLNLFLSMLAGIQAAALLIAAKRADAVASEVALLAENTALTAQVKKATDLLDEIHLHVANIGKKIGADMGRFAPGGTPPTGA